MKPYFTNTWLNAGKKFLSLFLVFLLWSGSLDGQDLLKASDLSGISVDKLSDADIAKFQQQLQTNNVSFSQAEQLALSKGMPQTEINKLRDRISRLPVAEAAKQTNTDTKREVEKNEYKTFPKPAAAQGPANLFGPLLFTTPSLSFEPNLRIATPNDYTLGPDDELIINIFGYQEASLKLKVQPEGTIAIPQVGIIPVSGLTIEDATKLIRDRMGKTAYPNLQTGLTKLNISLGNIRSIHITVLGAVKTGNYTVSSLTTLFNSLYICGGPDNLGTYRAIELIRKNVVVSRIDLYDFLMRGEQKGNVILKEGDVINFPVYQKRVTISGEVKRPGVFEMKDGENLEKLIYFAGGFTEKAYTAFFKMKQLTESGKQIRELPKAQLTLYHPSNADEILVEAVVDKIENSVTIAGSVYRPGEYELTPGLTLSKLIKNADGVKRDVFTDRGIITRTREDLTKENISFLLKDILNGTGDIPLIKGDAIRIASLTEFRDEYKVSIQGEVRKPGIFPYAENLTLKDILFLAGNFTQAGTPYRIEISRRISDDKVSFTVDSIAQVFDINTDNDLTAKGESFLLSPNDLIIVRKKPGYLEQKRVTIKGEILYPGDYTIQTKSERLSDLLKRAGGITSTAYLEGASLLRNYTYNTNLQQQKIELAQTVQKNIKDSSGSVLEDVSRINPKIDVNIKFILQNPGSKQDYLLEEGDILDIPKLDPLIKISGEVFQTTRTNYEEGKPISYYLVKAGGHTDYARLSKTYVIYPSGQIAKTRNGLFGLFRSYPTVISGSEIIVPKKLAKKQLSTGEVLGFSTGFISLASLIIVTINALR